MVGIGILSVGGAALQRLALAGPFEGLGHGAVEVIHKGFQSLLEIGQGGEVAAANHLAHQDAKPDFDLVHPGGVFGGVTKPNSMGGITQKGGAASLTLEDPFLALDAQAALGYGRVARHIADQAFGLVSVQIVQDKGKTNGLEQGEFMKGDSLGNGR